MNSIWVARDKDGSLFATNEKPIKDTELGMWKIENATPDTYGCFPDGWFPEVTWEDEPIELVIKEKEYRQ